MSTWILICRKWEILQLITVLLHSFQFSLLYLGVEIKLESMILSLYLLIFGDSHVIVIEYKIGKILPRCLYVASKHFIWYNRRYRDNNSEYRYQIKRQWLKNFACSRRFWSIFCKYQSIYWMQLRTTILNLWDLVSNATGSSIWRIFDKSCVTRR